MKTLSRLAALILLACVVYFVTVGRGDFYRIWDSVLRVIESVAGNYVLTN